MQQSFGLMQVFEIMGVKSFPMCLRDGKKTTPSYCELTTHQPKQVNILVICYLFRSFEMYLLTVEIVYIIKKTIFCFLLQLPTNN